MSRHFLTSSEECCSAAIDLRGLLIIVIKFRRNGLKRETEKKDTENKPSELVVHGYGQ